MTGLRERKKQRQREEILRAAEMLFSAQGYTRTTIEEIAAEAEVSIGTLYKYFGSKGGVMHELIQPVLEDMRAHGQAVIEHPPDSAEAAIAAMFDAYRFSDDWKSLNLLNAFAPGGSGGDGHLDTVAAEFEQAFSAQMTLLLEKLTAASQLNPDLNLEDAVFILYQHMYAHFLAHVSGETSSAYEDVLVDMHRRLALILKSWT